MLGGIFGDIVGSVYEKPFHRAIEGFHLFHPNAKFTDDTVLSIATADALINNKTFKEAYLDWGRKYPRAGFSKDFEYWLACSNPKPYQSFGNGAAMRSGPVGWLSKSLEHCLELAKNSAIVTHDHPEGIKGAQAVAAAVYMSRLNRSKQEIKDYIQSQFSFDLNRTLNQISINYKFDMTSQGSVPEAIICFLESSSTEDAIRKAVYLNGDADTQACIAGGIAEAFYNDISPELETNIYSFLTSEMTMLITHFRSKKSEPQT
jgi:ADP-ribosylglycohydrolase